MLRNSAGLLVPQVSLAEQRPCPFACELELAARKHGVKTKKPIAYSSLIYNHR